MSTQHFLSMSIVPSLDGYTCTWFEPVVIRGQLGPTEEKSKQDAEPPVDPVIDPVDPESATAQKMAGHVSDMLGALKQPLMDLQRQKVYRLVARSRVFKHGEDPRDTMMDLTRAQRLLSALNVDGAVLEGSTSGMSDPRPAILLGGMGGPSMLGRVVSQPCSLPGCNLCGADSSSAAPNESAAKKTKKTKRPKPKR